MRAFDIICVTFVTKLLLTSDVSSTPTKYSTSNPHSLISGDTHDVFRALRISDESDIQQERAPYPSFDSLLEYIPLTAAAKIARVKDLLSMSTLSKSRLDAFCNTLLMDDDPKWRSMAEMLSKDIKPESLRLFLSRHLSNEIEINSIIDPYTTLYTTLQNHKLSIKTTYTSFDDAVNIVNDMRHNVANEAEQRVLEKMKISKDKVNVWMNSLWKEDVRWDQFTVMLAHDINPDDIKKMSWKRNILSEETIWFLSYTKLFKTYKANQAKLSMDNITLQAFVETFKNQEKLQIAKEEAVEDFKNWLSNLDTTKSSLMEILTSLAKAHVESGFIEDGLQKRMSKDEIISTMNVYRQLLADFEAGHLSLEKPLFDDDFTYKWSDWHDGNDPDLR